MRLLIHIGYNDFLLHEYESIDRTLAVLNNLQAVEEKYENGYKYSPVEDQSVTYKFIDDDQVVEAEKKAEEPENTQAPPPPEDDSWDIPI